MAAKPLVLVVDDEPGILRLLQLELTGQEFDVVIAHDGAEALRVAEDRRPDIVVADIVMPNMDGLELMRRLREHKGMPVILLTARVNNQDKVLGLELGADDYLAKPFNPRELSARVRAVLRRGVADEGRSIIEVADLKIDLDRRLVTRGDKLIQLTGTEWRLLEQLATNAGRVMFSRELLARVWSDEFRDELQYLRGWISSLRKKIEVSASKPRIIRTVSGVGYLLDLNGIGEPSDTARKD